MTRSRPRKTFPSLRRAVRGLCAGLLVAAAHAGACGEDSAGLVQPAAHTTPSTFAGRWIDRPHEYLSARVTRTAEWFDRFFDEPGTEHENLRALVRISSGVDWTSGGRPSLVNYSYCSLRLPGLEDRLHLIIESNTWNGRPAPTPEGNPEPANPDDLNNTRQSALLRWFVSSDPRSEIHVDTGASFHGGPRPRVRLYGRRTFDLPADWQIVPMQSVFWTSDDHLGETTGLDLDRRLDKETLLRLSTQVTFTQNDSDGNWDQSATLYHDLDPITAVAFETGLSGSMTHPTDDEKFRLRARYRKGFFRPWLFYEIQPELDWPRDRGWVCTPRIVLLLSAVFGKE